MRANKSIYRQEALDHHNQVHEEGDVLHISPEWSRWMYWLLLAVLVTGLLYCCVGTLDEYATGPAVVQLEGRVELTSQGAGIVSSVEVRPGQRVKAGQKLVTLVSEEETASVERLRHEFELQLVRYLKDPADAAARQVLTTLRAERELAEARLETRALRAPRDGVVNDVRVQPSQYLTQGVSMLSLVPEDVSPTLLAFLPGHYRPYLRPGTSIRVELDGFHHEYQEVTVEQVGEQIIGPTEVGRILGPGLAGAFEFKGSYILVRARMPAQSFESEGQVYNYFDGMPARAEARVRTETILMTLVPGLKGLFSHGR
ncbi:efflux RND transporter periplasmic adaptor subunit [Archangium lipolyticum]|uniref:efflux RND transporter periplasmic adaptor subunit n=1 Tax=Archangium lipolyticum TaxID=2970465 RepID=UPI002149C54D|nr:HlyD family efflux transporter periplasmic adaptor subunit [Archangium lipolyticum]